MNHARSASPWRSLKEMIRHIAPHPHPQQDCHRDLLASLLVMAWLVEARDPYTGGHLWRVSRFAELLAEAAGLSDIDIARIAIGGFLHDLGKIGVPDAILKKPGSLTDGEFEAMRTHPEIGMRMLAGHPLAQVVRPAVQFHHERLDGSGYPHGHAGAAIPLDARIVGLCDAFDAMTSARPYRGPQPIPVALAAIRSGLGTQFDPRLGDIFLDLGAQGMLEHIVGHSDDGIPLRECVVCGPTLVVRREDHAGTRLFCGNCGGEFVLRTASSGELCAAPTGRTGSALERIAEADTALIARLVRSTAGRVELPSLVHSTDASTMQDPG